MKTYILFFVAITLTSCGGSSQPTQTANTTSNSQTLYTLAGTWNSDDNGDILTLNTDNTLTSTYCGTSGLYQTLNTNNEIVTGDLGLQILNQSLAFGCLQPGIHICEFRVNFVNPDTTDPEDLWDILTFSCDSPTAPIVQYWRLAL